MSQKRVVVTGIGVVSPLGNDIQEFWKNIVSGKDAASEIQSFDTSIYPHHRGCEVKDFDAAGVLSEAEIKVLGRASQFALLAADQALRDSDLINLGIDARKRTGVVIGTTFGEAQIVETLTQKYVTGKTLTHGSGLLKQYNPNALSVNIGKKFSFGGPNLVIPTACAAGNYAIGHGAFLIKTGKADFVISGGSDPFSHVSFSGFSRLGVMSGGVCQPFDKNRKGMMVGEGAGMLVLESYDSAKNRGANIYGEILSYGLSCDANHMTIPDVKGMIAMMKDAIEKAGILLSDIDYICAHGTGTVMNDKTESKAINELFYNDGNQVPVSSVKSMLGHTMGAASAIEAITCLLAIKHGMLPPTINFENKDPECNIDCVPNIARKKDLTFVLNNAAAFGGNNASLLLGRV